jgi:hypothetical protein
MLAFLLQREWGEELYDAITASVARCHAILTAAG